ncbi:LAETG motif-containing sortase-dependent surface protein [Kitasatospora sp. NPDC004240]
MKLRRVWATAAVATVMGSATLMAAPLASATGSSLTAASPSTTPTASASASASASPSASASASTSAQPSASASPTASTSARPSSSASPSAGATVTPSTTPTPSDLKTPFPDQCEAWPADENSVQTSLRGLPGNIVAGSGWHEFTYRATNISKRTLTQVDIDLHLGTVDPRVKDVEDLMVTVEWWDASAGQWKNADRGAETWGFFASARNIGAGQYADAKMRIMVDGKAPASSGFFLTAGFSMGKEGNCSFGDVYLFGFEIAAAGGKASGGDATGKTVKVSDLKGVDELRGKGKGPRAALTTGGNLAETGSSSATPVIAGVGAATLLAGAATVVVLRRRKGATAA